MTDIGAAIRVIDIAKAMLADRTEAEPQAEPLIPAIDEELLGRLLARHPSLAITRQYDPGGAPYSVFEGYSGPCLAAEQTWDDVVARLEEQCPPAPQPSLRDRAVELLIQRDRKAVPISDLWDLVRDAAALGPKG